MEHHLEPVLNYMLLFKLICIMFVSLVRRIRELKWEEQEAILTLGFAL